MKLFFTKEHKKMAATKYSLYCPKCGLKAKAPRYMLVCDDCGADVCAEDLKTETEMLAAGWKAKQLRNGGSKK